MLDMTTNITDLPAWQTALRPGDTIVFNWPFADPGTETPRRKKRTSLILEVARRDGRVMVELAYGTSSKGDANRGQEIHVFKPNAITAAGLDRPTRFVCARRLIVPADHSGFDLNPKFPTPVLGHLDAGGIAQMNGIRARIHALRDIAAERRRGRAQVRLFEPSSGFTVEHRRRRKVMRPGPRGNV